MTPLNTIKSLQIRHKLEQHFRTTRTKLQTRAHNVSTCVAKTNVCKTSSANNLKLAQLHQSEQHLSSAYNSLQLTEPTTHGGKRKRSWSRAVFTNLQRKGLEILFQQQKYITKPDRRKLAARLNLTDAQVKVWFQNRRMKWRHTRENFKSGQEMQMFAAGSGNEKPEEKKGINNLKDVSRIDKSQEDDDVEVVE